MVLEGTITQHKTTKNISVKNHNQQSLRIFKVHNNQKQHMLITENVIQQRNVK